VAEYYEGFAAVYERWAAHMTEDVPFYVELAREADGPIVELAVGTGRVAIPVARETGRPVIGIDRSPAMLEQARGAADEAGVELELRLEDMRELALEEPAALIYCPFRSLLHLPLRHRLRCRPSGARALPVLRLKRPVERPAFDGAALSGPTGEGRSSASRPH
jgi:SAM-dependent methyltransferase